MILSMSALFRRKAGYDTFWRILVTTLSSKTGNRILLIGDKLIVIVEKTYNYKDGKSQKQNEPDTSTFCGLLDETVFTNDNGQGRRNGFKIG